MPKADGYSPVGPYVILDRDMDSEYTESGIFRPQNSRTVYFSGTVVEAGEDAPPGVTPGSHVKFSPAAQFFSFQDDEFPNRVAVHAKSIYAVSS